MRSDISVGWRTATPAVAGRSPDPATTDIDIDLIKLNCGATENPRVGGSIPPPGHHLTRVLSAHMVNTFFRPAVSGIPAPELCRKLDMSRASFYTWRSKYGGLQVSDVKRPKEVEEENRRLKEMFAESQMEAISPERDGQQRSSPSAAC
jgi:putative transposase